MSEAKKQIQPLDEDFEKFIEETDLDDLSFALWMMRERQKLNQQND